MIKVTHYSGDRIGGAARAATRLHRALNQNEIVDSRMVVVERPDDDYTVDVLGNSIPGKLSAIFKTGIDSLPRRLARLTENTPRSAGWASTLKAATVNSNRSDIAHLHWINGGFLSVEEIGKITKPVVWTFHDMWPFCGSEHLAPDTEISRWKTGYNRSPEFKWFDFDRWVWARKKAKWTNRFHIVTPSRWLAECVQSSDLMRHFPVHIIPNALDTDIYKPTDKQCARRLLNLPLDRKLILFGAIKGTQLSYKGWDLLMPALAEIAKECPNTDAVIMGQGRPQYAPDLPIKIHWLGHLHDDFALAAVYSAADVAVIPSRQENLPQTGTEAQSCGCPVVAFDATGLKDIVVNNKTGFLVEPYNSNALASAIVGLLKNEQLRYQQGLAAQERALKLWASKIVAKQYAELYRIALDERKCIDN